ncbi:hypothetical protein GCM10023113_30560 [Cellulomonas oligotrophica]|uniref:Uncharacterized protein n=1 Tax=Cellulomonas oligotrophica TaxID=931536 RepID=A0ABQ4DB69_9CELL|nr:hypothetical protein Col01nite_21180 [Cellulomonas oligotrophica]
MIHESDEAAGLPRSDPLGPEVLVDAARVERISRQEEQHAPIMPGVNAPTDTGQPKSGQFHRLVDRVNNAAGQYT